MTIRYHLAIACLFSLLFIINHDYYPCIILHCLYYVLNTLLLGVTEYTPL